MRCKECKTNKKKKDFFGKIICFRCEYQRKIKLMKTRKRLRHCRICELELPTKKWVYCSRDCAVIGERKQKKEYWTMNVA